MLEKKSKFGNVNSPSAYVLVRYFEKLLCLDGVQFQKINSK